jgi:integrase
MIDDWLLSLRGAKGRPLAGTTKSSIRSLLSKCFDLAAKHEFISAFEKNPMHRVEVKGVSKRQKEVQRITVDQFRSIRRDLPEVLNMLVVVDAALGLRISELLALKWEDLDFEKKTIFIRRKFTRGRIGKTKTPASCAMLPVADGLIEMLIDWKKKIGESEWIFPSTRTGGPRSGSQAMARPSWRSCPRWATSRYSFSSLVRACGAYR